MNNDETCSYCEDYLENCECSQVARWFKEIEDLPYEERDFERIPESERPNRRRDICAFIKLDSMLPANEYIVSSAEHDIIFLDCNVEDLDKARATKEDILYLVRCGVFYSTEYDGICMLV